MKVLFALAFVALVGVQDSTIYVPGNGVSLPQVVKQVKADYTEEAKQNRIEGKVGLEAVVLANGTVGDVKVVQSLDSVYGLDKNAVAAMKQWEFKPGTKDNKPVAVRIHVEMAYTLK
jgi:periplasmic protein TonB